RIDRHRRVLRSSGLREKKMRPDALNEPTRQQTDRVRRQVRYHEAISQSDLCVASCRAGEKVAQVRCQQPPYAGPRTICEPECSRASRRHAGKSLPQYPSEELEATIFGMVSLECVQDGLADDSSELRTRQDGADRRFQRPNPRLSFQRAMPDDVGPVLNVFIQRLVDVP